MAIVSISLKAWTYFSYGICCNIIINIILSFALFFACLGYRQFPWCVVASMAFNFASLGYQYSLFSTKYSRCYEVTDILLYPKTYKIPQVRYVARKWQLSIQLNSQQFLIVSSTLYTIACFTAAFATFCFQPCSNHGVFIFGKYIIVFLCET